MYVWRKSMLFSLGGCAYLTLELAFRGRTDSSMFAAGGLCFLLIGWLNRAFSAWPGWLRAVLGALVITAVELAFGLTVNRDYRIWDYRGIPGNFQGQICPKFTLIWILIAWVGAGLYAWLEKEITGRSCRPVGDRFL